MEFIIQESKKSRFQAEVKGADHTICNVLVEELWNDKNVANTAYAIDHPLVGVPKIIVETDAKSPKEAMVEACKRIKKTAATLGKSFQKA